MKSRPRISIALCTFNGDRFLVEQLESIAGQSRTPDELVICDDVSQDSTIPLLEQFANEASFPVHIHSNEHNIGSTKNFEKAIRLCTGDIIALADQDDVWRNDKLAQLEIALTSTPVTDLVFSDASIVDENLASCGYLLWQSLGFGDREQQSVRDGRGLNVLLKHSVVTGATMAFWSHLREIVLPIPEVWVHDGWIALMTAIVGRLAFIPEPLISYRQHTDNQIGVASKNWRALLQNAQRTERTVYMRVYSRFAAARERVLQLESVPDQDRIIQQIEGKMAHMYARASMPKRRLTRLPIALRELLLLRYHRFSGGLASCAKDILLF